MIKVFKTAIINLDIDEAINFSHKLVQSPSISTDSIFNSIKDALYIVGQKYEKKEYFLSELIMAGEIVKKVLEIIQPRISGDEKQETIATIILATVKGDLHDLGKNIFAILLTSSGFNVIDLGIDVEPQKIVQAIKKYNAEIIGLSALLTTTIPEFGNVVNALKKAGLRKKVKVIIGGAATNQNVAKSYDVDAWCNSAVSGLRTCQEWIKSGNMELK